MPLLWNLPFFKMVPPKTNCFSFLKPWADNSSTNQYSYQLFYGWGMTHLFHPISKMHIVGEGPGETPLPLRCLSYLISSLLTDKRNLPAAQELQETGLIHGSGRSPGEGNGNPLQYSCLENPMDRGAWRATVRGVAKSRTQLSD